MPFWEGRECYTSFFKENSVVAVAKADLCLFWRVGSVIYHQGLFFRENSVGAAAGNLCLFWKVGSVIYYQRSFFEENSVMVVA
jgi:hypothetical protein